MTAIINQIVITSNFGDSVDGKTNGLVDGHRQIEREKRQDARVDQRRR